MFISALALKNQTYSRKENELLYEVKTTSGYGFRLRGVTELKVDIAMKELKAKLSSGKNVVLKGVTGIEAREDSAPWANGFEMVPPAGGAAGGEALPEYEFRRESSVPVELATTTFCPLERLMESRKLAFNNAVVAAVKDGQRRRVLA